MNKKVLIITYYWPPSGGGGVQRWLKFTKYLPEYGWDPIIFTPENPDFELQDESLLSDVSPSLEVIKLPIWEPFGVYKRLFGGSAKKELKQGAVIEKSKPSFLDQLVIWIRGNMLVPDARRFWVKPAIKFLKPVITDKAIDLIITTGPPHSMHLIGLGLKKATGVKWLADFRDPWSDWDVLDKLKVSKRTRDVQIKMEREVLDSCDLMVTVSRRLGDSLAGKANCKKIEIVNNGVDDAEIHDFNSLRGDIPSFRIIHTGLLNEVRNPVVLWQALEELCDEIDSFRDDLEVVLAGTVSSSVLDRVRETRFHHRLNYLGYVSHQTVFEYYATSSVMLLLLNQTDNAKWILPGKMYEYMFYGVPILTLGVQDSDVRDILDECDAGEVHDFHDHTAIKAFLIEAYSRFKEGKSPQRSEKVLKYSRKNLTAKLASSMDELF